MARAFLIFFFLIFLVGFPEIWALKAVTIGVVTDPTTRIGREQKVAINLAAEKFSELTLLTNVSDLSATSFYGVYSYVQNIVSLGANAIIAGGTTPHAFISGIVGDEAEVPVVSLAPSPSLTGQFLIQMSYPDIAWARCVAYIVKAYNWRKVIAVYEDDVFNSASSLKLLLSNALHDVGSTLEYCVTFSPADSISVARSNIIKELNYTKITKLSTVFIILRMSEVLAPILFEESVSLRMMSKGYIWICGNDIITLIDSSFTTSFISKNMQGVVGIKSYINETAENYTSFQSNFQQRFKMKYKMSDNKSFDPGVCAVRAYDIVSAISLAAIKSEENNKTLVENLVASNFTGFSGNIRPTNGILDDNTRRYSAFRIINVVGRGYWELGIWVDRKGFYASEDDLTNGKQSTEISETVVVWPGRATTPPGGLRKLKVLVPANTIWDNFVVPPNPGQGVNGYRGFCIDVFTATISLLGYEILYDFSYNKNITSYDDLVNQVQIGNADIIVGDTTIRANRAENVSFTKPYMSSGLAMIVPVKIDKNRWDPTNTFSWALWICIFVLLLYYILLVWIHELVEESVPDFQEFQHSWFEQLGASLMIVCNAIFMNLDNRIRSYHTKVVIILWFFVAQLVLNSFTASLSSILVTQRIRPEVDGSSVGCDGGSFVPNYLKSVLNYGPNSIVEITRAKEYNDKFTDKSITSAYLEIPYLRVFLSQYDNYTVINQTKMVGGIGFALPKGSFLAEDMSEAILKLHENGQLRQLEKKWFPVSLTKYELPDDVINKSLGLSNYTYIFVISSCLALVTILHQCYNAICNCKGGQVVEPEDLEPIPEVTPVVMPRYAIVQQVRSCTNNEQRQQWQALHDDEQPMHDHAIIGNHSMNEIADKWEDIPLHDDVWQDGKNHKTLQRAASSSNISTSDPKLQHSYSSPPPRVKEIEGNRLHNGT